MNISLSPMDYYFYRRSLYTIQFIFEYRGHLDQIRFETNLFKTLVAFPVVTSRLKILSETDQKKTQERAGKEIRNLKTAYKLFIGKYQNRAYADALKLSLSEKYKDSFVVKYE